MKAKTRREYLEVLEKVRLQDGNMSVKQINQLFCDILTDLLLDSVYMPIPQDKETDQTEELEVSTVDG